jgi:hypothetical protein
MYRIIRWMLTSIHLLSAAAWFGAMTYNLVVLHPRARRFFGEDDEQFEAFVSNAAQGARWKVIGGLATIGITGLALIPLARPQPMREVWLLIMIAKTALLLVAGIIFWRISWRLWPTRVFATLTELPVIWRKFRAAGMSLIVIAAIAMLLGVWASISQK